MKKTQLAAALGVVLSASMVLAGCGASNQAADTSDDGKVMTVDLYDQLASGQSGLMKGWFAKLMLKKFNIKINIISPSASGGGDQLFETRSAAGNVGDIIIVDNNKLRKLAKAGLVSDMTPYLKGMDNLNKFKPAAKALSKGIGKSEGIWGYPEQVSSDSPTKSSAIVDPDNAPYIRWDYYREIGYPRIKNLDDYVTVLKQMQDRARKDTGKNNIYAISLFKDWDDATMRNATDIAGWFGYMPQGDTLFKPDGTGYETPLKKDGIYQKVLQFLYKCNQAGILDPESATQDWNKLTQKVTDGEVLSTVNSYMYWTQNTPDNLAKGQGMFIAPLEDMKPHTSGFQPLGNPSATVALGSKAKNKQRLVKFINYLYSSEWAYGMQAMPPDGLAYTLKNGKPVLTQFGERAAFSANGLKMPASWGGGDFIGQTYQTVNYPGLNIQSTDPKTGEPYNPRAWSSYLNRKLDPTTQDWSNHMDGAKNAAQYMEKTGKIDVVPGSSFVPEEASSQMQVVQSQIKASVVQHSWKAVMAKNEAAFNKEMDQMIEQAKGFGYADVEKFNAKQIARWRASMKQIVAEYGNKK